MSKCLQCSQRLTTLRIPQFDWLLIIFTAGHNQRLLRMPMHAFYIGAMTSEHTFFLATQKVKYTQRSVVTAAHKFIIGRTKTEIANGINKKNRVALWTAHCTQFEQYLMPRIGSLWAWNIRTLFMFDCQYFTKPVWSPVTIQLSLCDQTIVRTGLSCACTILWMQTYFAWGFEK